MALAVYRRHAFSLWRVVAVVVALPAALNGALAVAEQQVRDSDGSSGSLAVLQVLAAGRQPDRVLARDRGGLPARRGCLSRAPGRSRGLTALRRCSGLVSVIWISLLVGVLVAIASLFLLISRHLPLRRLVGRRPGAAGRATSASPRRSALARARARALLAVRRRAGPCRAAGAHRHARDPRGAQRARRLERQRHGDSSSSRASRA